MMISLTDLHGVVFTLVAVLQVQVNEPKGDAVTFLGAPAPVVSGMRRVSVRIPRRLHPPQQHGRGREGEQEEQQEQQAWRLKISGSQRKENQK